MGSAVCLAALVLLLAVAFADLGVRREALAGLGCAALLVATGTLPWDLVRTTTESLWPVLGFLVASFVVAHCCAVIGVFGHLGTRLRSASAGSAPRALTLGTLAASLVTALLSLDATVVLVTPVLVVAAAGSSAVRPLGLVPARLANSASILLPVSNLTNLLVLQEADVSFVRWAALLALPWLVAVAAELLVLRLVFARDLAAPLPVTRAPDPGAQPVGVPLVILGLMLVGFAIGSPLHVEPVWPAAAAAVALGVVAVRRRATTVRNWLASSRLGFAVYVWCLSLVVAATVATPLGVHATDWLARLVRWPADGLPTLLVIAAVAMVLANLVNNLPATLVLVPLVAPLGTGPLLALVIGVGVGAGWTYPGSLANLLWRRSVRDAGGTSVGFTGYSLWVTPLVVAACTTALALVV